MRKAIFIIASLLIASTSSFAQSYCVVESEKIFKSIAEYNSAIETLDELEQVYITNIENAYATIEEQYETYKEQVNFLSDASRQAKEAQIIENENKVTEYRENTLGDNGELMKKRIELIQPIQDKVVSVLNNYAQQNGYSMIIDLSTSPSVIFYTPEIDKTETIINLLK